MKKDNKTVTKKAVKEKRQGYKHTPLGWIPDTWDVVEFQECIGIRTGQVDPKSEVYKETILIAPNHIESRTGRIIYMETASAQNAISGKYAVSKGDVIYSKIRPYLMKAALSPINCLCSADMYSLYGKGNILNKYILMQVLSQRFTHIANKASARTGIPKINREEINVIPICLPPLDEQVYISELISTWDEAISKTQQLIEQLQRRNKGLMQELLTGRKRLPGYVIPWKKLLINAIAKEVSLKNKEGKNLTVLSCTKYDGLVPSLEYFGRRVFGSDTSTYKVVPQYHFAYATNHIEEGSIGYQNRFGEGLISPMYIVFKTNNLIYDEYLFKVLKSHQNIHEYRKRMEGSIDRRGGLRWDSFSKIKLQIPELNEQKAIASIIQSINDEIQLQETYLRELHLQKNGLMQKLLIGEIRVK